MKKRLSVSPLSILMVILISGVFYSVASAAVFQYSGSNIDPKLLNGYCGDGKVASTEECDDGNTNNGDGCSSTCEEETTSNSNLQFNFALALDYALPNYSALATGLIVDPSLSLTGNSVADIVSGIGGMDFQIYTPAAEESGGPSLAPPSGDVIPNFSGLIVNGVTEMYGSLFIDSDGDGDGNVIVDSNGNIKLSDTGDNQHVKIWNGLNLLDMKSTGLAIIDSPWIILDTATLDIQSVSNGGADLVVNVDGYLHANRIGSFYSKYTTYSTSDSSLTSGLNELPTPQCDRADEYAVSHWYNVTGYNAGTMSNVSFLGVARTYSDNVPKGFTLRMYNGSTAVNTIKVGVTCFNSNGYRPAGGEAEI